MKTKFHVLRARWTIGLGMFFADTLAFIISTSCAALLRSWLSPFSAIDFSLYLRLTMIFYGLFLLVTFLLGLYETTMMPDEEKVKRYICGIFFVGMAMGLFFFGLKIGETVSRIYILSLGIMLIFWGALSRISIHKLMIRIGYKGVPVGILAKNIDEAKNIQDFFYSNPECGIEPVIASVWKITRAEHENLQEILPTDVFKEILEIDDFATLLFFTDSLSDVEAVREEYRGVIGEVIAMGRPGEHSEWYGMSFCQTGFYYGLSMTNTLLRRRGQLTKRIMDLVLGSLGLVVVSPLFLLLMLLVKISSQGPIFFVQPRRGKEGKTFGMIKFRTMVDGAPEKLGAVLDADPTLKAEWEHYQKLKHDPRVTWIGRFLRRTSLDELPQLINILKGDMSLVGPRPIVIGDAVEQYGGMIKYCDMVLPGLTGLWQITARNNATIEEHASLDYQYVMTWSVWKDLLILLKTPFSMLSTETS